ncbi:MAG TPA: flippase [bacterium]|nr:flippase [bacterium]HPN42419.1 flippase [bacterium]
MNAFKSIITNTLARSCTEIMNRFGSAIFWILIARQLGAEGLGALAFAIALFSLFSNISTLGLGSVVVRDVAQDRSQAGLYYGQVLKAGLPVALFFTALMIIVTLLLSPKPDSAFAAIVMAFAIIPASGFYWSKSILSADEKMGYIAIARLVENVFKVGAGIALLFAGAGIREMILVFVISKVLSFAICFKYAADKVAAPVWRHDSVITQKLVTQAPSFSLITVFNSLFWSLTVIILTKLQGEAEAGIFSAAFKLVELCIALAGAYGQAFFPVVSRIAHHDLAAFVTISKKSIKYISLVTIAIVALVDVMAPQVIGLLYGQTMAQAVPVLRISIWLVIPFGIIPVLAFSLISRNLQKLDLSANIAGAVLLTVLNVILIPQSGATGAALAMTSAGVVFFAVEYYWVSKRLYRLDISLHTLKPVFGGVFMSGIVFLLKDTLIFVPVISGLALYVFYLWISKTLTIMEINSLRQPGSVR